MRPTALMLALSAAVLALDPSVPTPRSPFPRDLREDAEHWRAVASYAEAFPSALARRVSAEAEARLALEDRAARVAGAAKAIQIDLG